MSVSFWQDHSKTKMLTKDIVVIGGGIAGLSTAYWFSRLDPNLKITIVEKGEVGAGASGRNAGFITCGSVEHFNRLVQKHGVEEALDIWRFSEKNLELLTEHFFSDKKNCNETDFQQQGSFSLASSEVELKELKKSAELMRQHGIGVEELGQKDIEKRIGVVDFVGGIKYLADATINPIKLLRLIRNNLEQTGNVEFLENNEVYRIASKAGQKQIVTSKVCIESPIVILATNAYSPLLEEYFLDKIYPTRGQILCTEPTALFMESACYAHFVLDYFRQLRTGEILIGGFRQLQKDVELGYADLTSEVIQHALEDFLNRHIPKARKLKVTHRWSGIMGFSSDGQPLIGTLPSDPQTAFLGGFTAHGLGLAFHSAKVLAEALLFGKSIPSFLSAKRFN